jgi:Cof subfamily protein (haloacid dehalogenase superfamily)
MFEGVRLPRMLVCDLDGTLLNPRGAMSRPTIEALGQAVACGVNVVFATGRRHFFASEALTPVPLDDSTALISSNGAITRTLGGETRHRIGMPIATAQRLCDELAEVRSGLVFTFDRTGPGALVVEDIEALRRRIPRWIAANEEEIRCCTPLESAFDTGEQPIQSMICGTVQEMEDALSLLRGNEEGVTALRGRLSIHHTKYPARDLTIVDLMAHGCSKGVAVARLVREAGLDAADVCCLGDNMNDLDMLAFAGQAVVMRNAPAELLAIAAEKGWRITGGNEEDGAAQAILRMLEKSPAPVPAADILAAAQR